MSLLFLSYISPIGCQTDHDSASEEKLLHPKHRDSGVEEVSRSQMVVRLVLAVTEEDYAYH